MNYSDGSTPLRTRTDTRSNPSTHPIALSPLYVPVQNATALQEHIDLVYQRARAVSRNYALTAEDVVYLRPKFWALHTDMIATKDGAATTLITIQYNLAAGTLAPFAMKRPELQPLLQKVLNFDVSAQFLLTEVGHGLDARNIETTATLNTDGSFTVNTPTPAAAKCMPPTGPSGNMARVGIVIARLIVDGEDRGVRPFVVALGNGKEMCSGISAKLLPTRAGSNPVDHAITYFNHVHLPKEALLGSLEKPRDFRQNFLDVIWRIGVGSLAVSTHNIAALKMSAYIAGRYSLRRKVMGPNKEPIPIIAFRTQQLPVLHALALSEILDVYGKDAVRIFTNPGLDSRIRHGIAAALKAVMVLHCQDSLFALSERCGAQGLFEHNQIIQLQLETRGVNIAEGDILALSIRLAPELLMDRYSMPKPLDPNSILARHEFGLFKEARNIIQRIPSSHRGNEFNRLILPLCQPLIEAIGHRMAYEAAVKAMVDQDLVDLFVANTIKHDASWYIECAGLTRRTIAEMEDKAVTALMPKLEFLLESTGAAPYCHAPIVSDQKWNAFVNNLPQKSGNVTLNLIPTAESEIRNVSARL